jgi:hypothetical protein
MYCANLSVECLAEKVCRRRKDLAKMRHLVFQAPFSTLIHRPVVILLLEEISVFIEEAFALHRNYLQNSPPLVPVLPAPTSKLSFISNFTFASSYLFV